MGRYKTCLICGKAILPTELYVPYNQRYAHSECFNKVAKELAEQKKIKLEKEQKKQKQPKKSGRKPRPKAELKEGMSEEDYAKKKKYYEYLRKLLNDEPLSIKQLAVSERYIDRYNFTFEGMYQTLVYMNEILGKELTGDIVGVIPFYYTEAEKFNQELDKIGRDNKKIRIKDLYPERIIYMKPEKRKINQIDMESVGES